MNALAAGISAFTMLCLSFLSVTFAIWLIREMRK